MPSSAFSPFPNSILHKIVTKLCRPQSKALLQGHLHVGSTITLTSVDGKITHNVKVVGVYRSTAFSLSFETILTTTNTVQSLSPAGLKEAAF